MWPQKQSFFVLLSEKKSEVFGKKKHKMEFSLEHINVETTDQINKSVILQTLEVFLARVSWRLEHAYFTC